MMQLSTVRQIFDVLRGFKESYSKGISLKRSYRMSVQRVADSEGVAYQTIGDACRRRLRLNDINEFYELLEKWTEGDTTELVKQIKGNTYPNYHSEIDSFFGDGSAQPDKKLFPSNGQDIIEDRTEVFSLRLAEKEARMLKALAEIEAISLGEYLANMVTDSVKLKMKKFAQEVIREK